MSLYAGLGLQALRTLALICRLTDLEHWDGYQSINKATLQNIKALTILIAIREHWPLETQR